MKKITRECLHCSNPITGIPDKDNMGYYMYCLDCDASFDVDLLPPPSITARLFWTAMWIWCTCAP